MVELIINCGIGQHHAPVAVPREEELSLLINSEMGMPQSLAQISQYLKYVQDNLFVWSSLNI